MAFNGAGVFSRLYNWVQDAANNINIMADRMDNEMNGFSDGLTNCVTRDGQTTIINNIPFNSFKITGLGNGVNPTDAVNYGQVFTNPVFTNATFTNITVTTANINNLTSSNVNISGGTITGITGFSTPDFLIINAGVI